MEEHNHFLLELLCLEGCGDFLLQETCRGSVGCMDTPEFQCEDYLGTELYCKACTVGWHVENPTHRIKVGGNEQCALLCPDYHTQYWNSQHFKDTNLWDLGLQLQLGHPPGECCSNLSSIHNDFVVLNINGVHNVTLCFCECQTAQSCTTQVLCMR